MYDLKWNESEMINRNNNRLIMFDTIRRTRINKRSHYQRPTFQRERREDEKGHRLRHKLNTQSTSVSHTTADAETILQDLQKYENRI